MVLDGPNICTFFAYRRGVIALPTIDVHDVNQAVGELLRQSAHILPEDYLEAMRTAPIQEHTPTG